MADPLELDLLTLYTRQRATEGGWLCIGALMGIIRRADGEEIALEFDSYRSAAEFLVNMTPNRWEFRSAEGEDRNALLESLRGLRDATVH